MDLHNRPLTASRRSFNTLRDRMNQGFTLIEILIVILIISIVSSIAALTISRNQQKQYEYLAKSLAHLLTLAEEEAMLRPRTLGLAFTKESYQFFEYQNQVGKNQPRWSAMTDKIFGKHVYGSNIKLVVKVENKTVALDGQPHLIISESGDIAPFTIWIGKEDQPPSYQVTGFADGNILSGAYHAK